MARLELLAMLVAITEAAGTTRGANLNIFGGTAQLQAGPIRPILYFTGAFLSTRASTMRMVVPLLLPLHASLLPMFEATCSREFTQYARSTCVFLDLSSHNF